ncbi:MAG: hypothetical protein ACOYOK_06920 [Pseudobdellovibrionaceae bacterium]
MSCLLCLTNGLLWTLFLLWTSGAYAHELRVIDVKNNIAMSEQEPRYRDYYLSGDGFGELKKNLVITAQRKINVRDASGSQAYGEILIPVGQLKVIQVFNNVAVAREFKLLSREDLPVLDQAGILVGDTVNVKDSFIDKSKPKQRKPDAVVEVSILKSSEPLPGPALIQSGQASSSSTTAPSTAPTP